MRAKSMKLVMTALKRADPFPGGEGIILEMETSAGPMQMRLTYQDAARVVAALQALLPDQGKSAERLEVAIDPVNQDAVIQASFADRGKQETRIPRSELSRIVRFLEQASRRFEAGGEMRQ
jgi:hypothetical protein